MYTTRGRTSKPGKDPRARFLRTSDVARAVGVHPNTVRVYESLGFLPPVPRSPAGYRMFTAAHLTQMRIAWMTLRCTWLGGDIRRTGLELIGLSKSGDLWRALDQAHRLQGLIRSEIARAEAAAGHLEHWAGGAPRGAGVATLRIGQAAARLGITIDMLRNWERNGLVNVRRDPANGYRLYSDADLERIAVIRVLKQAGYSTMAILRMLRRLDRGDTVNLRKALDTPGPGEDAVYATDRWLSTLRDLEQTASGLVSVLHEGLHGVLHGAPLQSANPT